MTPPPEKPHGRAASRLNRLLDQHLIKIGDKGTIYTPRTAISVTPNTWLEPDLFYVSAETEAQSTSRYHTTADIVVEVISPGSAIYDRNTKADTYAALKVKELWLVDELSGAIEVRVLKDGRYEAKVFGRDDRLKSMVFPSMEFNVRDVFND